MNACGEHAITALIAVKREGHHPEPLARFTEPPPLKDNATAVEGMRHLLLTMSGPLFRGGHRYSVVERDGGSLVRIDAHYGGPLGTIFGAFTKNRVLRDLNDELVAIQAQAALP